KNDWDAEEVMINGFMKVFQNIAQYEHKGSFEGWIRRIMVNEALQHLRRKEPLHLRIEKDHFHISAPASAESEMAADDLFEMLHELPAGYRAVFNLYAIEGYSHKEIADMLNITEGTSKSQLSKARTMLQRMVNSLATESKPLAS
ncbi:MAG: sigma-70 family RNA polymerase sigma factor, partial [Hymenobacteraceae bacterium]|nr:sigma-70 family RNA polymerase sigma factor [Hymenobacteraceae bacterium]MDX5395461.1 sigma-70 family RNA polymerase sigma factor [Hymenobacteraceae bacterium]MDX5511510.1 sigma-70 family RNA polymerase sigma factor [Hymenobacteraceae bacterium]